MEFHDPFSKTETAVFDKINKNHHLIHFHGNNCCGVFPIYVHKKYFDQIGYHLDMSNVDYTQVIRVSNAPELKSQKTRVYLTTLLWWRAVPV